MKLLGMFAIAMLVGCSNPSAEEETMSSIMQEQSKGIKINLVRVEFDQAVILQDNKVTEEYFFFDVGYYDTIPVYVPNVDTLEIATIKDGEYCYNTIGVTYDSIYKLKVK